MINRIFNKVNKKIRIDSNDIVRLLSSDDIFSLGRLSGIVKSRKVSNLKNITYIVDRNINYTNICTSKCRFCAFYKEKGDSGAYLLEYDVIKRKILETIENGGIQILMQGGLHPDLKIDYYEDLLKKIKSDFNIHIHAFSPPEILNIAKISNLTVEQVIIRLKSSGLNSIPGGGAEILDDEIRSIVSPEKCCANDWLEVMRCAHNLDLRTTATMVFGQREKYLNIANHLIKIRDLQDETAGFTAFIPWPFQPGNTELGGVSASAYEYLKVLAVSRIVLDNIDNIQASWVTQGAKIAQIALSFGANDFGSTMLEENVVRACGVSNRMDEEEIKRLITDAGFIPKRRNMFYEILETQY